MAMIRPDRKIEKKGWIRLLIELTILVGIIIGVSVYQDRKANQNNDPPAPTSTVLPAKEWKTIP